MAVVTTPGIPVKSAMAHPIMAAAVSWVVRTNRMPSFSVASRKSMVPPPPGIPKMYWTPSRLSIVEISSTTLGMHPLRVQLASQSFRDLDPVGVGQGLSALDSQDVLERMTEY